MPKRERIEPHKGDKRYVRRDKDRRAPCNAVKPGEGACGDPRR
jgi:hypothetical protein